MKTLVTFALALAVHLALGWAWTLGAAILGGFWAGRGGWVVGMLGVGGNWLALVLYNYAVAPEPVAEMAAVMGALMDGWPGFVTVGATVLIGALLGTLGGVVGAQLRLVVEGTKGAACS